MNEYPSHRLDYYIDSLNRFTKSSHPLMLIIGPPGSDKNALLIEFIHQAPQNLNILRLSGDPNFEPEQLIDVFCQCWSLKLKASEKSRRYQLNHLLTQLKETKNKALLIIENAHTLTLSSLAAISHLSQQQESGKIALHIIAVGDNDLEEKMASLLVHIPPRLFLKAFNHQETIHYIRYRLGKLGKNNPIVPTQAVMDKIYKESKGFPSIITHLTQQWLYQHVLEEGETTSQQQTLPAGLWKSHKIYIIALSGLAIISAVLLTNHFQKPQALKANILNTENHLSIKSPLSNVRKYGIQVFSVENFSAAKAFIVAHQISREAKIQPYVHEGRTWYAVILGNYKKRETAASFIHSLPKNLQAENPHVRALY